MSRGSTHGIGSSSARIVVSRPARNPSRSMSRFVMKKPQRRCSSAAPVSSRAASSRCSMRARPSMKPAPWRSSAPTLLWKTTRGIRFRRIAAARPSPVRSASASGSGSDQSSGCTQKTASTPRVASAR
jgi:hypothetical protein